MDDLLDHPQAIRLIPIIQEKGTLNMREFTFYGRMSERTARALTQIEKTVGRPTPAAASRMIARVLRCCSQPWARS